MRHFPPKKTKDRTSRGYGRDHIRMRNRVLKEEQVCGICGLPRREGDPLTADHIIPKARGGKNVRSNYRAAHRSCNSSRGMGGG